MNLLHLDSSILGEHSVSRQLSAAVVARLTETDPSLTITYRDLAAAPIPHLTLEDMTSDPSRQILQEFLDADIVVIGAAFYNFSIASQLKAWVDRILVAGQTFSYDENGPHGLAGAKRVIVAMARGGAYGPDSPRASFEHAESLLRSVLTFIGVTEPEFIIAEGLKISDDIRDTAIAAALEQAAQLEAGLREVQAA